MIALNLDYANGSFSPPVIAVHGELLAVSKTENGAIAGLAAVSKTIQEIQNIGAILQPEEDIPTTLATDTAKRLLSEAQTIASIYLMPTTIEGSDGDLLLHWDTASKGIVLVCPGIEGRAPQIYKETLEGKRATHS